MTNSTRMPTHSRSRQPVAIAANAETIASATMNILPTLAIAGAVIAAKVTMLALLIQAV